MIFHKIISFLAINKLRHSVYASTLPEYPKAKALAQFVNSEAFFPIP